MHQIPRSESILNTVVSVTSNLDFTSQLYLCQHLQGEQTPALGAFLAILRALRTSIRKSQRLYRYLLWWFGGRLLCRLFEGSLKNIRIDNSVMDPPERCQVMVRRVSYYNCRRPDKLQHSSPGIIPPIKAAVLATSLVQIIPTYSRKSSVEMQHGHVRPHELVNQDLS